VVFVHGSAAWSRGLRVLALAFARAGHEAL
jgi:hypothetical protein